MRSSSVAMLVLGLEDIATRRGRATVTVLSVALAVTIAVAIVGLGASGLDPAIAPTQAAELPADPADISGLPVFPSAVGEQAVGRILTLITAMQVLLGGSRSSRCWRRRGCRSGSGSGSSACSTHWAAPQPSSRPRRR
jgi:hypothetical protein